MKKAGLLKKIIILVLVLVVPGFLYYLLATEGKNRYKSLPIFGLKQVAKTFHEVKGKKIPDTIYHKLPDFTLTDQNGKQVSLKTFGGEIVIFNFFYKHCPGVCSMMNVNVSRLDSIYAKNNTVYFASITVDPGRDTQAVLKNYAGSFKNATVKRLFLTGDTSSIYNLARNGFLVNALQTGKDDFIYSDKLILIDSEKRIRGYYTGASTDGVGKLDDEIKVLIAEELLKNETPLY